MTRRRDMLGLALGAAAGLGRGPGLPIAAARGAAAGEPPSAPLPPTAAPPRRPRALYLSAWGIGDAGLRGHALALADRTEIDALVIDVKGDRSMVPFPSRAWAAAGLGPQSPVSVPHMAAMVQALHARGLYLIARVVAFKDDRLVAAHPAWALRDREGRIWRDRESLAWIDPVRDEAWEFSIGVAEEAAALGFDEIQFDYLRFPDTANGDVPIPPTEAARVAAVTGFLAQARQRLAPRGVRLSADVFGYTCWNLDDTRIGQRLDAILPLVDVVSPMLYPSGFTYGIPGHRDPVADPGAIVALSLRRALARTGVSPLRLRPWLQAFTDYAFDHRAFGPAQVRAQIDAAEEVGTDGWMLWNPRNRYDAAEGGLRATASPPVPSSSSSAPASAHRPSTPTPPGTSP